MTNITPISIWLLETDARKLGVSIDAPIEEVQRSYERFRRIYHSTEYIWEGMKSRKRCKECKKLGYSLYMLCLPCTSERVFCSLECVNLHQLNQLRTNTIQEIINKYRQVNPAAEEVYLAGLLNTVFELFEVRGDFCQCEHVPFTPQCQDFGSTIRHHIQTCLKTRVEIENFKNEMLRIIESAVQSRPIPQITPQVNQPNLNVIQSNLNSDPYPTPPPSPNFTASTSNSLTNNSNSSSTTIPVQVANSYSNDNVSNSPNSNFSNNSQNSQTPLKSNLPQVTITSTSSEKSKKSSDLPPVTTNPNNNDNNSEQSQLESNDKNNSLNYSTKNDNFNVPYVSNESLTTQKEQVIQLIQTELKNSELDLGKYSDWKQTIEKISDSQQLSIYKNSLIQHLQVQKSSFSSKQPQSTFFSSKNKINETNHSKFVWLILGSLLITILLIGFWKIGVNRKSKCE